jgi:putative tryptophan/tyrosine transport system substrate-binding protein
MKRPGLAFLVIVLLSVLAAPLVAQTQPADKVYRIGLLRADGPVSTWRASYRPLLEGLRELGYVEGSNIAFEVRSAEGKYERLPALAADLVDRKVDVFFASGDEKILALKQATITIPIVMTACDAIEVGFISSLAHPGGNLTGVTCMSGDLAVKRLELLKEAVPRMSRLAVLFNPGDAHAGLEVSRVQTVARSWGISVQALTVRDPLELEDRFVAMTRERADTLFVVGQSFTWTHAKRIVDLAAKSRLPAIHAFREAPDAGGLMSYGPNGNEMDRRAATYIAKIFKGARPADLPVEQPTKFEFVINLKTAKALGLTIPPSVLARADEVIQ